jgi:branched-chain amino acid transport system ATP-binding protein
MRNAFASQTATIEYKRAKAKGTIKQLVCRNIDVDYDGVQVLFDVDFEVEEGEIVALLGTNGAGKSNSGTTSSSTCNPRSLKRKGADA